MLSHTLFAIDPIVSTVVDSPSGYHWTYGAFWFAISAMGLAVLVIAEEISGEVAVAAAVVFFLLGGVGFVAVQGAREGRHVAAWQSAAAEANVTFVDEAALPELVGGLTDVTTNTEGAQLSVFDNQTHEVKNVSVTTLDVNGRVAVQILTK